jgi:predicted RNA-binding Zn ribbon-like protein
VASYPRLGLPLPLELANTLFARAGQPCDALATPGDLAAWLQANAEHFPGRLPASSRPLVQRFRHLRDVLRQVFIAVIEGAPPAPASIRFLNELSAAAPQYARLSWSAAAPHLTMVELGDARATALATVARAGMQLLAGPELGRISRCQAPGCVLFFLKEPHRRHWCSAACGNRARVARHYLRHRSATVRPDQQRSLHLF